MQHLPYELQAGNRFHYYEQLWKKRALDLVDKHRPQKGSLFDFGCGRGEMLGFAKERGYSVSGADGDPKCVELSQTYGDDRLLEASQLLHSYGEASFDIVSCLHVLEHVENPKDTLRQLALLSRDLVVLAVPNPRQLIQFRNREHSPKSVNPGHLQSWDHSTLRNLAETHCRLRFVEWTHDATILSLVSEATVKALGHKAAIWMETGPFLRLFPFHCCSVIALFRVER